MFQVVFPPSKVIKYGSSDKLVIDEDEDEAKKLFNETKAVEATKGICTSQHTNNLESSEEESHQSIDSEENKASLKRKHEQEPRRERLEKQKFKQEAKRQAEEENKKKKE